MVSRASGNSSLVAWAIRCVVLCQYTSRPSGFPKVSTSREASPSSR